MLNPFVSPPFIECPKCSEAFWGVINIGEYGYSRRCAKCSYPTPPEPSFFFPLPKLKKTIVYLDQCLLSGMVKAIHPDLAKVGPTFETQSFELLDSLSKLQLLICPGSQFHEEESIFAMTSKEHKRVYELLSHGISYKDMWTIFRMEIYEQLRNWLTNQKMGQTKIERDKVLKGKVDVWQGRFLLTVDSNRMERAKSSIEKNKETIFTIMQPVFARWERESGKKFNYWYEQELSHWPFSITDGYKKYLDQMKSAMAGGSIEPIINGPPAFFSTFKDITDCINKEFKDQDEQQRKLNEFMSTKHLESVPFIRIYTSLMSALAAKVSSGGMKKENIASSFFNDILIISSILPFCDAIFLERQMAGFLRESPINNVIDNMPKIFSSSNKEEFLDYLRGVEKNASSEHREKVCEVYGDDWGRPFTSVLEEYRTKSKDENS